MFLYPGTSDPYHSHNLMGYKLNKDHLLIFSPEDLTSSI